MLLLSCTQDLISPVVFNLVTLLLIFVSLSVSFLVVQMGEEYYHAKDYTKALK